MSTTPSKSSYDTVVVGGGAIGLSCAWRITQRGRSVLVAERDRPGAGASGVAAGMLAPITEADFGEEGLLRANLASAALWPGFAAELAELSGLPSGLRESGALVVAADRDDAEELRRLHGFQRRLGLEAEWLTPSAARRAEPGLSPRIAGAIHAPQDHRVDPRAVVAALTVAVERAGGEVAAGTEVESLDRSGVTLAGRGRVQADNVVLAAGCWSAALTDVPVRPVKGQVLHCRTRGPEPLCTRVVRSPRCYVVDRGDGRVVIGATVEERGFDVRVTAEGVFRLLEAAIEVLPDVEELVFEGATAGLRPATPDNLPLVGLAEDGLVLATGHYRNGVLLAPLTAQAVAALVCGEPAPADAAPFAPRRLAGSPA